MTAWLQFSLADNSMVLGSRSFLSAFRFAYWFFAWLQQRNFIWKVGVLPILLFGRGFVLLSWSIMACGAIIACFLKILFWSLLVLGHGTNACIEQGIEFAIASLIVMLPLSMQRVSSRTNFNKCTSTYLSFKLGECDKSVEYISFVSLSRYLFG